MCVICSPLTPFQMFSGYCLGLLYGLISNIVGVIIGIVICHVVSRSFKQIFLLCYSRHFKYCRTAEQEGFLYVTLFVLTPQINPGTAAYLITKINTIKTFLGTISGTLPSTFLWTKYKEFIINVVVNVFKIIPFILVAIITLFLVLTQYFFLHKLEKQIRSRGDHEELDLASIGRTTGNTDSTSTELQITTTGEG
ncbi:hypothetical protein QTN25_001340 [Entamoeba marina]